jgi:hypothetical protein
MHYRISSLRRKVSSREAEFEEIGIVGDLLLLESGKTLRFSS